MVILCSVVLVVGMLVECEENEFFMELGNGRKEIYGSVKVPFILLFPWLR